MKRTLALLLVAPLLAACKAHMIETRGGNLQLTKSGLQSQGPKGGVVRYLNTGMDSWRKARRADAEKQMTKQCGGAYTITAEGTRSQLGTAVPVVKGGLEFDQYTYLAFDCKS